MPFDRTLEGRRVRLVHTDDPYTDLKPGSLGTIDFTDDADQLHIHWDDGSHLALIPGYDRWEVLPDADELRRRHIESADPSIDLEAP
jgi:hypothetical protein